MSFVPYENFYIISKLTPTEVQSKLEKVVGKPDYSFRGLFSNKIDTPFRGYLSPNQSIFKPNINYRSGFIPEILLKTEPYLEGSRVHVKMKLLDVVFGFMCFFVGFAVLFTIIATIRFFMNSESVAEVFVPIGMVAFVYLLGTRAFKSESTDAKSTLLKLLEGEIETALK